MNIYSDSFVGEASQECFLAGAIATDRRSLPKLCLHSKFLAPLASLLALFFVTPALAEKPEEVLAKMFSQVKAAGSPAAVVDFIHWPSALEEIKPQQRVIMGVTNATQLSAYYKKLMNDPAAVLMEQMTRLSAALPEEQKAQIESRMKPMVQKAAGRFDQVKKSMMEAEYEVKGSEITGDTALVSYSASHDSKVQEGKIKMIKVDGKWLVPNITSFGGGLN